MITANDVLLLVEETSKPKAPDDIQLDIDRLYKELGSIEAKKRAAWTKLRDFDQYSNSPEELLLHKQIDDLLDRWNSIQAKLTVYRDKYSINYKGVSDT